MAKAVTRYTITKKREKKSEEIRVKTDFRFNILINKAKERAELWWRHELEKLNRRKAAYLKKKELEYKRKMENEIRELEWKPRREYKDKKYKINVVEFAMQIAQENARLRDTDADWRWRCISCGKMCEWWELAWWHRYSRRFKGICLEPENINAQCHSCNFTMWPRGDTVAKAKCEAEYDLELDVRFGEGTAKRLKEKLYDYMHWGCKYDFEERIEFLIKENFELWRTKNFRAKGKNWRDIWDKYNERG